MVNKVAAFLSALGITGAESNPLLTLIVDGVQWKIKNLTNLKEIPEGLETLAVKMAAGEFLTVLKGSGQLEGFELDEAAMKSIQEGDTNITFAIGEGSQTPEQRLDALINYLIATPMAEIYRYRRVVW